MQFSRLQAASYSVFSVLGFITLTFASIPVHAQATSAQSAKNDHPLIARFPDSEIVEYEVSNELNHQLVLGT